jgi:hypothetical protein
MTTHETIELAALERAIRSVEPGRAPEGLRSALRADLVSAAAARDTSVFSWLTPMSRLAFAAIALVLAAGGLMVAASAPGDVAYPIKDAIVRLIFPSVSDELRAPSVPDVFETASPIPVQPTTAEPGSPAPTGVPSVPPEETLPAVPTGPSNVVAPNAAPTGPNDTTAPAHAIPAVPPDPAGPRATPAVPPTHH